MIEDLQFDDYAGGIEDGIVGVLTAKRLKSGNNPTGYLKEIALYGGELDEKTLRENLGELQGRTPLALVSYTDGQDKLIATAAVGGEPRTYRHECSFGIIAVAEDARGGTAQRRGATGSVGAYQMVADFRRDLSGLWIVKRTPEEGDPVIIARRGDKPLAQDEQLLTFDPLKFPEEPPSVQYLARLPDLTAYAVICDTYWEWTEDDQREEATPVDEIVLTIGPAGRAEQPSELPGVIST